MQAQKQAKAEEMIPELSLIPNNTHPDVVRRPSHLLNLLHSTNKSSIVPQEGEGPASLVDVWVLSVSWQVAMTMQELCIHMAQNQVVLSVMCVPSDIGV